MQRNTESTGPAAEGSAAGTDAPTTAGRTATRRVPVWVFVVAGVVLVALAGTAALLLSNRGGEMPPAEAEVITLPVPTPTIEPMDREAGTAFYDALPSTVLDFVVSGSGDAGELAALGALESYRLEYTDGTETVVLLAGQWATAAEAEVARAASSQVPAPADDAAETSATDPLEADSGDVTVGGTVVGTYTMETTEGDDGVLTWSNDTVVLQLSGPAAGLRDLYAGFPL